MKPLMQRRMRFCLRAAEQIAAEYDLGRTAYDVDSVAELIESTLPDTWDEAMEEAEKWDAVIEKIAIGNPPRRNLMLELRTLLGVADPPLALNQTLKLAIERLKKAQ